MPRRIGREPLQGDEQDVTQPAWQRRAGAGRSEEIHDRAVGRDREPHGPEIAGGDNRLDGIERHAVRRIDVWPEFQRHN